MDFMAEQISASSSGQFRDEEQLLSETGLVNGLCFWPRVLCSLVMIGSVAATFVSGQPCKLTDLVKRRQEFLLARSIVCGLHQQSAKIHLVLVPQPVSVPPIQYLITYHRL
jgi:hypothetical protein